MEDSLLFRKIVVKVGSNVLTREDGTLNISRMSQIVDQLVRLKREGVQVILVTSGAVAAGRAEIGTLKRQDPVSSRQLWSAVGQVKLINRYADLFQQYGMTCAQVLTTKENFGDRLHYLNMRNCMQTLLEHEVVPIVNENDTISVTELMFTDNDELSGLIASMMDMEALVLLSNVDGVYTAAPGQPGSELIPRIPIGQQGDRINISATKSNFGRGGMLTKFHIAGKLAGQGISVFIANGYREEILTDILYARNTHQYTHFIPAEQKSSGVRKWLAHSDDFARGEVVINDGARDALLSDKAVSLLMIGIVSVAGFFRSGDIVRVKDASGRLLGLGKAAFSSGETETEKGGKKRKPFIHYDYLYLF
ncbi:MAG: glutamate 5-kinase [Marinilabiliales bacterium]|nr:glutamate 5-kinase [Marinilabiliales bacterium]